MGATGSDAVDEQLPYEVQFRNPVIGAWAEQNRPRFRTKREAIIKAIKWHHGSDCDVRVVHAKSKLVLWLRKGRRV